MLKKLLLLTSCTILIVFTSCKNKPVAKAETATTCGKACAMAGSDCNAKCDSNTLAELSDTADIKVIYFHTTRRCATCEAVEAVTKEALNSTELSVPFSSLNCEEKENADLVKRYNVSGTTLLIIKGDSLINFTNTAFLMARSEPDQYKTRLLEMVNGLIN